MPYRSKAQLEADNEVLFPDNDAGQISASDLRDYNKNIIDSMPVAGTGLSKVGATLNVNYPTDVHVKSFAQAATAVADIGKVLQSDGTVETFEFVTDTNISTSVNDRISASKVKLITNNFGPTTNLAKTDDSVQALAEKFNSYIGSSSTGQTEAQVVAKIKAYTGQLTETGSFARNRLPILATGPNRAGVVGANQAQAVEELANARGAISKVIQTNASGAIVASTPPPADEISYSRAAGHKRLQATDDTVEKAINRLDKANPNLTDHQRAVFAMFDDARGWEDDATPNAEVATTTLPTGTAQNNPAQYVWMRAWTHQGTRLSNRRVFIRIPKALRDALADNRLRVVARSSISTGNYIYNDEEKSDTWTLINDTDPTWDYYYADPVNIGVGEALTIEQYFPATLDGDRASVSENAIPDTIARKTDINRDNVYNQSKDIVQGGTGVTVASSDTNKTITITADTPTADISPGFVESAKLAANIDVVLPTPAPSAGFTTWQDLSSHTVTATQAGVVTLDGIASLEVQTASAGGGQRYLSEVRIVRTRNSVDTVLKTVNPYGPRNLNSGTLTSPTFASASIKLAVGISSLTEVEEDDVIKLQSRCVYQLPSGDAPTMRWLANDCFLDIGRAGGASNEQIDARFAEHVVVTTAAALGTRTVANDPPNTLYLIPE